MVANTAVSLNLLNYLRFGALGSGVVYGIYRSAKFSSIHHAHVAHEQLKKDATKKAEGLWAQRMEKELGMITDPDAPGFDMEKYLIWASN